MEKKLKKFYTAPDMDVTAVMVESAILIASTQTPTDEMERG